MTVESKRRKSQKPKLLVVFDTNALYTGSASDLVHQEAANLIKESTFPDLEIRWYLPEMVRHERQYQMQKRALELLPPIAKVERLLGHKLAITEQILIDSVEKAVSDRLGELGLLILAQDYQKVNWHQVSLDAAYRKPPFQDGESEKGFRDRMIVECFLQLVDVSPRTAKTCRVVLVSGDRLVAQAVEAQTVGSTNTRVLATLEELKGLINTLVSQVDEEFLASLKPKAQKFFFIPKEKSTLLYKESIREKLEAKFATELASPPLGASSRKNGTWLINEPNFVKKTGRRIQWTSRIEIEAEAFRLRYKSSAYSYSQVNSLAALTGASPSQGVNIFAQNPGYISIGGTAQLSSLAKPELGSYAATYEDGGSITSHKGLDIYEAIWSADVTTTRDLRRPTVDELRHVGPTWEQVA
jgi:hypothetical protein